MFPLSPAIQGVTTLDISEEIATMQERATHYLNEGEVTKAEKIFKKVVRINPTPSSLNNWAMCRFYRRDPEGALKILEPNLKAGDPNPFARALAAQALTALGRKEQAEAQLRRAIADFEAGMKTLVPTGVADPKPWREYTVIIKRAAGDLGHHEQVLDLYHKWERHHVTPEDRFLAGVAAFNLGRFGQALSYWRKLPRPEWAITDVYVDVAKAVDTGVVPAFPLEYRVPSLHEAKQCKTEKDIRRLMQQGSARMIALGCVFSSSASEKMRGITADQLGLLVLHGGEWGVDLAKRLLSASSVSREIKLAAAGALVDLGVYKEGEPIQVVVNGETHDFVIRRFGVVEGPDPELDLIVQEARRLRDAGKIDEAIEKLSPLMEQGALYPPAMLTLANLFRSRDRLDEAESLLSALEDIVPDDPAVLFNLAGLYLQRGDLDRARSRVDRIDPRGQGAEFQRKFRWLKEEIERLELLQVSPDLLMDVFSESSREEQEDKPISLDLGLSQALRGIPVGWVNAACRAHDINPASKRLRKERARELASSLADRSRLMRSVLKLDHDEKELLRFILGRGGWTKLSVLAREFGSMEGDGFWWEEQPPRSPLGRLWSKALVFVGRAKVDGRRHKVAVIPMELRENLAAILRVPRPAAQ